MIQLITHVQPKGNREILSYSMDALVPSGQGAVSLAHERAVATTPPG